MAEPNCYIGIDLGTANTRIAVHRNDRLEIIPDGASDSMPSCVAFTQTSRLVGVAARDQASINPQNTIFDVLRFIGCKFNDENIQIWLKHTPYRVYEQNGYPVFRVEYKNETRFIKPVEMLSMIFAKVKDLAEAYLDCIVDKAIVIVPSRFGFYQRQMVVLAASIAGIDACRITAGSTAATLTYALNYHSESILNVAVIDLGAGTWDVTIAEIEQDMIEVLSVDGNMNSGGDLCTRRLMDHVIREMKNESPSRQRAESMLRDPKLLRRAYVACERVKLELSTQKVSQVEVMYLDTEIVSRQKRPEFEVLNADIFLDLIPVIEAALRQSRKDKGEIHEIVMIGGSSRIPKLQRIVNDYFNGKEEVSKSLNKDYAAVEGAAILASILRSKVGYHKYSKTHALLLLDIAGFSYGVEEPGGVLMELVPPHNILPTKSSALISPVTTQTGYSDVPVFESKGRKPEDRKLLFRLPSILSNSDMLEIVIQFDACTIDYVSLRDPISKELCAEWHRDNFTILPEQEVLRLKSNAAKFKADEEAELLRMIAKSALQSSAFSVKDQLSSFRDNTIDVSNLIHSVDTILNWLDENEFASTGKYLEKQDDIEQVSAKFKNFPSRSKPAVVAYDEDDGNVQTIDTALQEGENHFHESEKVDNTLPTHSNVELMQGTTLQSLEGAEREGNSRIVQQQLVSHLENADLNERPTITTTNGVFKTPLHAQEFRLIHRVGQGDLRLCLQKHRIEYPPRYYALSYACGSEPKDQTVICESPDASVWEPLHITKTLRNALHELVVEGTPIWVDAICIDQNNIDEKSRQIGLMHRIYRRAERVMIWLGKGEEKNTDLALDVVSWIAMPPASSDQEKHLKSLPALESFTAQPRSTFQLNNLQRLVSVISTFRQIKLNNTEFERLGIPPFGDPVWKALGNVFSPTWLFRLWTFQELMLGRECFVVFGKKKLPWRAYFDVGMQFSLCGLLDHCVVHLPADRRSYARTAFSRLAPFLTPVRTITPFWHYLQEARHREVTETVDRIYAVLGLTNDRFRSKITLSYTEKWKHNYWNLFQEVGKAVIETTNAHVLLASTNSRKKAKELPSWCPDFNIPCEVVPFAPDARAGTRFKRSAPSHWSANVIKLPGAKIDQVDRIVPFSWSWPQQDGAEMYGPDGIAAQTLRWLDICWWYSRDVYAQDERRAHEAYVMTILGVVPEPLMHTRTGTTKSVQEEKWFTEKDNLLIIFRKWLEDLSISEGAHDTDDSIDSWHKHQQIFQQLDDIWRNRIFFTTKKGRIGFASRHIYPRDHVCVLFSESHLYIMRDHIQGHFKFISDAYVDEYISGDGFGDLQGQDMVFSIV